MNKHGGCNKLEKFISKSIIFLVAKHHCLKINKNYSCMPFKVFYEKITVRLIIVQLFHAASGITHNRDNFLHLPMLINDTDVISLNHSRLYQEGHQ